MRIMDISARLLQELRPTSAVFRHAVRAALATAVAFAAARGLGLSHEMWVIVSVVVILRPSLGGTLRFGRDRVLGTIAGALAGIMVVLLTGASGPAFVLVLVLSFFATMFLHVVHYLGFVTLLSFTVVLGLGMVFPEGWKLGLERIVDTMLGALIGFGAAFFIWPARAAGTVNPAISTTLKDFGALFHTLADSYLSGNIQPHVIISARRKTYDGLQRCRNVFAEASAEPGLSRSSREDLGRLSVILDRVYDLLMAMDTVVRRVSDQGPPSVLRGDLQVLAGAVDVQFSRLASYAENGEADMLGDDARDAVEEMFDRIRIVRAGGDLEHFCMEHRTNLSAFLYHVYAVTEELSHCRERLESFREGGGSTGLLSGRKRSCTEPRTNEA